MTTRFMGLHVQQPSSSVQLNTMTADTLQEM
jgi:hypothetical protein